MENMIPLDEQETVIVIPHARVSKVAEVYTCIYDQLTKLRELAESKPESVQIKQDFGNALIADVDRSFIRIAPKRKMSEKQRAVAIEHLQKAREKLNDSK